MYLIFFFFKVSFFCQKALYNLASVLALWFEKTASFPNARVFVHLDFPCLIHPNVWTPFMFLPKVGLIRRQAAEKGNGKERAYV